MAGEWLKMECTTPDKPEVLAITVKMGWDDPDLTVGKLFRLWRWFDQQTIDGNAHCVTAALLDRQCGASGFIQAVADVGWLTITDDGISLSNFDKHNGSTAKNRALTAKRVANHKSNANGNDKTNDASVTEALPREEKKREEKNTKTIKSKAESATASRLPADWIPSFDDAKFCEASRPDLSIDGTANRFRDYWIAQPGAKGRKLDWSATWRNWVRNEKIPFARGSPSHTSVRDASRAAAAASIGLGGNHGNESRIIDIQCAVIPD